MPKRRKRGEAEGARGATAGCGVRVPAEYYEVVGAMGKASIAPKGRARPEGRAHPVRSSAFSQGRRHGQWCPPGFDALRAITDDKSAFFEAAKHVQHPLSNVKVTLTEDLQCAVDKVAELRAGTPAWRLDRMATFEEWASNLERFSSALRAKAPRHVQLAAGATHVGLIMAAIDAFDWPYVSFARRHAVSGFPITGRASDTGLFRLRSERDVEKRESEYVDPKVLAGQ